MKKFFKRFEPKVPESNAEPKTVTTTYEAEGPMSRTVKMPFCKCKEDDLDEVEDDCDPGHGCGKPLVFCGNCFKLIKQDNMKEFCSCAFTERKLKNSKEGNYGTI